MNKINQKPIFICGAHKSGTSLLRSLFDSKDGFFTIPIETHFFQNMHFWVDNEYRRERPAKLGKKKLIEKFTKFVEKNNLSEDPYSGSITKGLFDLNIFNHNFAKVTDIDDEKMIFEKYISSLYKSIFNKDLNAGLRLVEKSVENAEFATELKALFPKAKFVHIVRNPYSNVVSLRKYKSMNFGYPLMHRLLKTLSNNYYYLFKNQRIMNDYKVVRYEDILLDSKKTIKDICDYCNIIFEDKMLTPTSLGKKWGGNSTTGKEYFKINPRNIDLWKKDIKSIEINYVNQLFPFVVKNFGYDIMANDKGFWKPVKGENFFRYIFNRMYRYYNIDY